MQLLITICYLKFKDVNEHKGTYETINMAIPPMPNANVSEQNDLNFIKFEVHSLYISICLFFNEVY